MTENSSEKIEGKSVIIPKGTEQETGLTRGETEKKLPVKKKSSGDKNKSESKIIPAGTEQETGLTIGHPDKQD